MVSTHPLCPKAFPRCRLSRAHRHAAALALHDYRSIADEPPEADDGALDRYVAVRALVVLGRYADAARRLKEHGPTGDLGDFLTAQLALYTRSGVADALRDCERLRSRLTGDPYLHGEVNFVLGYGLNLTNQFKAATRYLKVAADSYLEARLIGCEGAALFNLCVAYDHLDERALFDFCCNRLEGLALQPRTAAIRPLRHLIHRMRALRLVDAERYAEAAASYGEALEIVTADERWHDVGALGTMRLYCLVKLDEDLPASELAGWLTGLGTQLAPSHRTMLAALEGFRLQPFFVAADVPGLRRSVSQVESVQAVLLYDLALSRLAKAGDFALLVELAREAQTLSLAKQQSLSLVDFRAYEIQGLLKCGHLRPAQALLAGYHSDALERACSARIKRAAALTELMEAVGRLPGAAKPAPLLPRLVQLDLHRHQLRLDERTVDLAQKPVVEAFLQALLESERPLPLAEVHTAVYGTSYDPTRHDRRLHALIGRVRRLAGAHDIVLRRGGELLLAPQVRRQVRRGTRPERDAGERRRKILETVAGSPAPLAVSRLEALFPCSRRTIQLDLAQLVKDGRLVVEGTTRDRHYRVQRRPQR